MFSKKINWSLLLGAILSLFISSTMSAKIVLPGDEDYLVVAEEMPEPVGGMATIQKNTVYPSSAIQTGIQGKVYVMAYINENGGVDDVKLVKGIGGGCDEAAINAVKKTKFTPGKNKGVPVKVKLTIPLTFKIK